MARWHSTIVNSYYGLGAPILLGLCAGPQPEVHQYGSENHSADYCADYLDNFFCTFRLENAFGGFPPRGL